ncbi:urease accessory protein UreF [Amphritea sp. 1_MG-2023]|uniref:urease accessory protein UreF n=1 Tax=Amphritea sp. 1_MG-2023 TaxID=3062670 RepID=UPI0026E364EE|nr:urease accessory protein UreF [Amphritea sp. 1_MG-2023]MDO6561986.1 urease accessory protein UreF [Amphritea sp. 1_MG-2023]
MAAITTTDTALLRLMQLSSVSLPIGGYAFSQGLEYAIESGWIKRSEQVSEWLEQQLLYAVAQTDLPLLKRAMMAAKQQDVAALRRCNDLALACRETRELRLTDSAMGEAMNRLLVSLAVPQPLPTAAELSYVVLFGIAAQHWQIDYSVAALGFLWAWLENQVAAATKLVPLGQTQAQQLLGELQPLLSQAMNRAERVAEDEIGNGLQGLAIISAGHETQYSRLFRS